MSKKQMQEEKPGEEGRVVAKSKPMMNLLLKTDWQSPTGLGSSESNSLGDTQGTQFEFRPHWHEETRWERFERKDSIESSSGVFRCKHDHQCGETRGGNDKENHGYKVISPQL